MNLTRFALIGFVIACAWTAWPKPETVLDTHRLTRQFVIQSTLARFEDAVVVLGDSIVEASTLPRSVCGRPLINAGIGGASTTSKLNSMLVAESGRGRPVLIVVSLGTNDAAKPSSIDAFKSDYRSLISDLKTFGSSVAIATIPQPEAGLEQARKIDGMLIDRYNAMLPELESATGVTLIAVPPMPDRHTLDGIHLNAAGYAVWDAALLKGIERLVCKTDERTPSSP